MPSKRFRPVLVWLLCCSMIYTPVFAAEQLALPPDDIDSPEINHDPINETFKTGHVKPITATVTDNVGVKSVILFYRQKGAERYQQITMRRVGKNDQFSVTLDAQYYTAPGIEYYIQATDTAGNRLLHGYAFSPMKLAIEGDKVVPAETTSDISPSSEVMAAALDNKTTEEESSGNYKKWLWIGLGVLAVGALAGGGGGGGGSSEDPPSSSLELEVSTPTANGN